MSRSRLSLGFSRRPHRTRTNNTLVTGSSGAGTTNDRGATQVTGFTSLSPYYNNNFLARYQTYVNLYETSWEVRKIIDIPVDDAMRKPTIREGLSPEDELMIARAWEDLGVERQLRREAGTFAWRLSHPWCHAAPRRRKAQRAAESAESDEGRP